MYFDVNLLDLISFLIRTVSLPKCWQTGKMFFVKQVWATNNFKNIFYVAKLQNQVKVELFLNDIHNSTPINFVQYDQRGPLNVLM